MQLSIIIVSYNVKYFLEQCLCSVYKAIQPLHAEVWVVDNASGDGSVAYLQPKFRWVNFIAKQQNVGFAKANNEALFKCAGEYVLFLNPDTLLPEDCLVKSLALIETDGPIGGVGIRMIDGSGTFLPESKRSFPAPLTSFYKLLGLSRLFPSSKIFSKYSLGWLDEHKNHEIDVLAGAFMISSRKILHELKGFDERFFMYGEDIDLSYRIQQLGYKNYYFGESCIIHFKGESTKKGSLNYVKIFYQAMSIFVEKHYTGSTAGLFALTIQPAIWLRAGVSAAARLVSGIRKSLVSDSGLKDAKPNQQNIIAGSEADYNETKDLLASTGINEKVIGGHIITNSDAPSNTNAFNEFIRLNNWKEIIFVEGSLSFKDIIELVQAIQPKVFMRFHAKGTQSIIGSDSKNTAGDFISAEKLVE